ncbi:MAG TPA: ABC transporter permease [Fimbriimonas sp.]|nr:ABC transporter permease [Fimbriimonas sp.]
MIVRIPGLAGRKWRKNDPLLIFGICFLVLLLLFAIFGPMVRDAQLKPPGATNFSSVYDPVVDEATGRSLKPFQPPFGKATLGSDEIGRDVMARLAQGARISLVVGFVVQILALLVGVTVGVLGVYAPKWLAGPLMRLTDAMFAFPDILLAILIVSVVRTDMFDNTFLGPIGKMLPVIVALSFTAWPSIARLVRSQVASLKDREFVVAAKANGASTFYLATRHVLPQLMGILMAVSMIEVAGTILAESTLSFLGIGIQAPDPSWGSMINAARQNMTSHPIVLLWPCLLLSLTIFALNFVGDGLRALLDPKNSR